MLNIEIDRFFGVPDTELTSEKLLRRFLRAFNVRSVHTGELPYWVDDTPESGYLATLLADHGLDIVECSEDCLVARQMHGRIYTFLWKNGKWLFEATHDPVSGVAETARKAADSKTLLDYLESEEESGERAPDWVWWDGKSTVSGDFLGFDLETTMKFDGEYPGIVLCSAVSETGEGYLFTKEQILDFFKLQHEKHPEQIWCGYNIAEFDLPTMDYRIPRFRQEMHDIMMERLIKGRLYDVLIFIQLLDIGVYGDLFSRNTGAQLWPVWWGEGWGRKIYALGPQVKRWFGYDISKSEQTTFWAHYDDPKSISEDQALYALADSYIVAELMKFFHQMPLVRHLAESSSEELGELKGVRLHPMQKEDSDELLKLTNSKFGFQTHTIQFFGAMALSWTSNNGISVDVPHITSVIDQLNYEHDLLIRRLNGDSGRVIYKVDLHNNGKKEAAWVPEEEDPEPIVIRLTKEAEEKEEAVKFEVGELGNLYMQAPEDSDFDGIALWDLLEEDSLEEVESEAVAAVCRPEVNKSVKTYIESGSRKYLFVDDHGAGVRKIAVADYVFRCFWPTLPQHKRQNFDLRRLALKTNEWLYFFDITDIADIPDPVLRLNFEVAKYKKKIATVKSYLPGFCDAPKKVAKFSTSDLLRWLNLENTDRARLYPSFRSLLATGRTGAFDPNTQQVERDNRFRNCFIAGYGRKIGSLDYGAVEMGTQAEIFVHRYGLKVLASKINEGYDIHLLTAMEFRFHKSKEKAIWSPILGDSDIRDLKRAVDNETKIQIVARLKSRFDWYQGGKLTQSGEDLAKDLWIDWLSRELFPEDPKTGRKKVKDARQAAKILNFGVPGGMRPPRILQLARTVFGLLSMTLEEAEFAYKRWCAAYPDGRRWIMDGLQYLIKDPVFPFDPYYTRCCTLTGRLRGHRARRDDGYDQGLNEWHNTQFQGLAADGAKVALYLGLREGLSQVNFVHDENDYEFPEKLVEEHTQLGIDRMRTGISNVVSFVNITVGADVTERWMK